MKRILVVFICCCIAIMYSDVLAGVADTVARKPHVQVVVGGQENEADVEQAFSDNVPRDKSVAGMPHFAIVGKYKRFYLGIGANFRASGSFDFGDEIPSSLDFVPSSISPSQPGSGGQTRFSAEGSSIYLNFVAMPDNPNKTGLFFSGHFRGENYGFKMKHFYIKYRGLNLGYTHSAFSDNDAVPYTIDEQGASGQASVKMFNAMWTQSFGRGFSATIGVDAPEIDIADNDDNAYNVVSQRVPAIPLWLQYGGEWGHLRLSGILRMMQYRDEVAHLNCNLAGWGVQFSSMYSLSHNLKLYVGAVYGEGIANYIQDSAGLQLDAVVSKNEPSRLIALPMWSCHAGLEYNMNEHVQTNLLYSRSNCLFADQMIVGADTYDCGQYVAANLLYNVTSFVKLGIEYNYGYRKNYDGHIVHTNRLQCLLSVEI